MTSGSSPGMMLCGLGAWARNVSYASSPDGIAVAADQGQRLDRAAQKPSLARRGDLGGRSGVDDDGMMRRGRTPNEIVHRHRAVMRIAADKVVRTPSIALGVADRVKLVFGERWVSIATSGSDLGIA